MSADSRVPASQSAAKPKHPLASKTLWCHLLTLLVAIIATCQGDEWVSQHANWLQALLYLNIVAGLGLRLLTTGPVVLPTEKLPDRKISRCWAFIFLSAIFLSALASPADLPFAGSALADDPTPTPPAPVLILNLEAEQQIDPGDLAVIRVDPKSTAEDIRFTVVPLPANAGNWQPRASEAFLTNGTLTGTFTVVAAGNLNGQTVIATTTVTFGAPTPPPPVPPNPPTPPTPTAGSLWLVMVADETTLSAGQQALLANSDYWQGKTVLGAGHHYTELDPASEMAKPYLAKLAPGQKLPILAVLDAASGRVLGILPLPGSTVEVDAIVQKFSPKPRR